MAQLQMESTMEISFMSFLSIRHRQDSPYKKESGRQEPLLLIHHNLTNRQNHHI